MRLLLLVLLAVYSICLQAANDLTIKSPDGNIAVTLNDREGRATYSVTYRGEAVVSQSRLGLLFKDHQGFDRDLAMTSSESSSSDDRWEQPWGERRWVRDHYNELLVEFSRQVKPKARFSIRVRVFNDGLGFRYEVPRQRGLRKVEIINELTEFAVGEQTTTWWIPGGEYNRYEYLYEQSPAGDVQDAHTPITFRQDSGVHFSIHEAALVDYSAMSLQRLRPGNFKATLSPWSDGILVKTATPFKTPWRTIQISPDAKGLLNSDLILNLNEPNKLGDVSWIEPGKYAGIWWAMHIRERTWGNDGIHGATTEETKRYIDFAADNNFVGVLVEGWNLGWDGDWFRNGSLFSFTESYPDFDLAEVGAYALEKGTRMIGHHETSGDVSNYESQLEDALDLYQANGVKVIKTGYVADAEGIERIDKKGIRRYEWHDGQFMVNHHIRVLEEAAKRQIGINAHEPVKDTGLRRTYPNWLSREGARGMEYNAWGWPPNPPEHTAILPFTRMLSGPMDFTPGIFDLEPNKRPPVRDDMQRNDPKIRPQTTLAKQLALYVVLYSPVQMVADLPENYARHADAFQFIKDVPADWEQSIALNGEVGEYVTFVRQERDGKDWYLGALTNEEERVLNIALDFLVEGQQYRAEIYADGDQAHWETNPYQVTISRQAVTASDTLELKLASSGGVAIRFVAEE